MVARIRRLATGPRRPRPVVQRDGPVGLGMNRRVHAIALRRSCADASVDVNVPRTKGIGMERMLE